MSQYLVKQTVLEWLGNESKNKDWPHEVRYGILQVKKAIESGAFDAQGWQPIETAPKDGTKILVLEYEKGNVYQAQWDDADEYFEYAHHRQFGCGCCKCEVDHATHWMPLPELPVTANNRG